MIVKVQLKLASQPIIFEDVISSYEKGSFFCIHSAEDDELVRIPIQDIFMVRQPYKEIE